MALASEFITKQNGFITRYEDRFDATQVADSGLLVTAETENAPQEVVITCKQKNSRVCGFLSEGVKLSGRSEWKEMFGGGIMSIAGSVISAVDKGLQLFAGTSIQQPWMNRKFWVSTKPFTFDFSINFIADENGALNDVFLPAQTLLGFAFPRDLNTDAAIKEKIEGLFGDFLNPNGKNTVGGENVLGSGISAFCKGFAIPGPAVGFGSAVQSESKHAPGDAVTIVIGNMYAFGAVYLENVDVQFSPTMDDTGYPIWAKCNIKATAMDANYVDANGNFVISQWEQKQAVISDFVEAIKQTGIDLAENIAKMWDSTKKALAY